MASEVHDLGVFLEKVVHSHVRPQSQLSSTAYVMIYI